MKASRCPRCRKETITRFVLGAGDDDWICVACYVAGATPTDTKLWSLKKNGHPISARTEIAVIAHWQDQEEYRAAMLSTPLTRTYDTQFLPKEAK